MNEHRPNILHQLLHTSAPQSFVVWCRLCHKILFFVASISVEKDKKMWTSSVQYRSHNYSILVRKTPGKPPCSRGFYPCTLKDILRRQRIEALNYANIIKCLPLREI